MSDFVLDASVALSWFVDSPVPVAAREVRELLVKGQTALTPALWIYEMSNGLVSAERRKVLTPIEIGACCDELEILLASGIEIAAQPSRLHIRSLLQAAQVHVLTGYDASYLELAKDKKLSLATLDRSLRAAAKKAGVSLLP